MPNRALVWTLAALVVVLFFVPLVGTLGMGGMMGGGMAGMHVGGVLWLILTIVVIAALVALIVRGTTKG
jgi:hypothetical protein